MSLHMAFSCKYGTVWYYPASSKLWYLTMLLFVNFRKIDWHALESACVLSQLVQLAVCLAQGANFAPTDGKGGAWGGTAVAGRNLGLKWRRRESR
jgi:hypothetical protein